MQYLFEMWTQLLFARHSKRDYFLHTGKMCQSLEITECGWLTGCLPWVQQKLPQLDHRVSFLTSGKCVDVGPELPSGFPSAHRLSHLSTGTLTGVEPLWAAHRPLTNPGRHRGAVSYSRGTNAANQLSRLPGCYRPALSFFPLQPLLPGRSRHSLTSRTEGSAPILRPSSFLCSSGNKPALDGKCDGVKRWGQGDYNKVWFNFTSSLSLMWVEIDKQQTDVSDIQGLLLIDHLCLSVRRVSWEYAHI